MVSWWLAGAVVITSVVWLLVPRWFRPHLTWAVEATGVVVEVGVLASWPVRRRSAGRILLDLGRTERRSPIIAIGGGVLIGVLLLLSAINGMGPSLIEGVLVLLGACIALVELTAGARVTERGLLRFHGLTPWRDLDVSWTPNQGFAAERTRPRRVAWSDIPLVSAAGAAAVLHAWLLPGGEIVSDAVRVRFVADDRMGSPTVEFVGSPGAGVRAVIERRRFDGRASRMAEFELGEVARGDTLTVWWEPAREFSDSRRPFRLRLVHEGATYEQAISYPFPREEQLALPFVREHPIDRDGAIVIAYARSFVPREADTVPTSASDWLSWLALVFEHG